jgi:hypothetical protein
VALVVVDEKEPEMKARVPVWLQSRSDLRLPFPNGEQIDACFKPSSGNLRLRTPSSPDCLPSELPISWSQQGPPGSYEVTPPVITPTLTCQGVFDVTLGLTIWDDDEVAFFAIQKQGTDPALNYLY